ncbi:hypothetical protein KI387_033665, partial [Taxus chinensis]
MMTRGVDEGYASMVRQELPGTRTPSKMLMREHSCYADRLGGESMPPSHSTS